MFKHGKSAAGVDIFPGVSRRVMMSTDDMTLLELRLADQAAVPPHSHAEHAAVGYVVSGRLEYKQGGETCTLEAGDSFSSPRGVEHSIHALETVVMVEIFSPARLDLA